MDNRALIKVALIGNSEDRKKFQDLLNNPYVGVAFCLIKHDGDSFQICNISEAERFDSMLPKYLEDSHGIILCNPNPTQKKIALDCKGNALIIDFDANTMNKEDCLNRIKKYMNKPPLQPRNRSRLFQIPTPPPLTDFQKEKTAIGLHNIL